MGKTPKIIENIDIQVKDVRKEVEVFESKVLDRVSKIKQMLPKDLTTLSLEDGNKIEEQIRTSAEKVKAENKRLKDNRMVITRKFSEITKFFTTKENTVDELANSLIDFSLNWNKEKMRRDEIILKKQEAERLERERRINLESNILSHYANVSLKVFTNLKDRLETKYYSIDNADELKVFVKEIEAQPLTSIKNHFEKKRLEFTFKITKESDNEIHAKVLPKVNEIEDSYISQYNKVRLDLINFLPSRIEALKNNDAEKKKEEQERLRQKQEEEKARLEIEQQKKIDEEKREMQIDSLAESVDVTPSPTLSKGVSTKLKYYPKNHAELLKLLNWYLHNDYQSEDFEKLNKRLSFVRTACDKALNDGELIEGVEYREDLRVRKTR